MALPSSGAISASQIVAERLGTSGTVSMTNVSFRQLAACGNNTSVLPDGTQISYSNFQGKACTRITNPNGNSLTNYNLKNAATTNYVAGKTLVTFDNDGEIKASGTGSYAFSSGTFNSGDIVVVNNNGFIIGKGGTGGTGGEFYAANPPFCGATWTGGSSGGGGGPAMLISYNLFLNNSGTIGGGGRGGDGLSGTGGGCGAGGQGGAGYGAGGGGGPNGFYQFVDFIGCVKTALGNCGSGASGGQTSGGGGGLGNGNSIEGWSNVTYSGAGSLLGATIG